MFKISVLFWLQFTVGCYEFCNESFKILHYFALSRLVYAMISESLAAAANESTPLWSHNYWKGYTGVMCCSDSAHRWTTRRQLELQCRTLLTFASLQVTNLLNIRFKVWNTPDWGPVDSILIGALIYWVILSLNIVHYYL